MCATEQKSQRLCFLLLCRVSAFLNQPFSELQKIFQKAETIKIFTVFSGIHLLTSPRPQGKGPNKLNKQGDSDFLSCLLCFLLSFLGLKSYLVEKEEDQPHLFGTAGVWTPWKPSIPAVPPLSITVITIIFTLLAAAWDHHAGSCGADGAEEGGHRGRRRQHRQPGRSLLRAARLWEGHNQQVRSVSPLH